MSTDSAPEERKSLLQKIGPAFAIAMTALSAVFGSMSASQLQQSMYYKSQAAQDQSKSANQWGFFGFKRSRALQEELAAHESRSASGYFKYEFPKGTSEQDIEAVKALNGDKTIFKAIMPEIADADLVKLIADIKTRKPEPELEAAAGKIPLPNISKAIEDAEAYYAKQDDAWGKISDGAKGRAKKVIDEADRNKAEDKIDQVKKDRADAVQRLVFAMEESRYRGEGFINQQIGYLYDTRVLWSAAKSDYYKHRSLLLGYAMLVAQIGAVAASLALARKGGFLWLFVAMIGIVAVGFGGFAYLAPSMIRF